MQWVWQLDAAHLMWLISFWNVDVSFVRYLSTDFYFILLFLRATMNAIVSVPLFLSFEISEYSFSYFATLVYVAEWKWKENRWFLFAAFMKMNSSWREVYVLSHRLLKRAYVCIHKKKISFRVLHFWIFVLIAFTFVIWLNLVLRLCRFNISLSYIPTIFTIYFFFYM